MQSCQWCYSTNHISGQCKDQYGTKRRGESFRKCFLCGRIGHIAMNCKSLSRRGYWRLEEVVEEVLLEEEGEDIDVI